MAEQMGFKEVKINKAFEIVYEQIRDKILSGELQAGEKLPSERDLIDIFQCSRPTIREALRMLASKNYVTISPGSGTVVNKLSTFEAERALANMIRLSLISRENVRAVRNVCEIISIKWAAERRTERDIEVMQSILKRSAKQMEDQEKFMLRGVEFNRAMAQASYNQVAYILTAIVTAVGFELNLPGIENVPHDELVARNQHILSQHEGMLNCIIQQDTAGAQELARQHIGEVTQL